MEKSVKRNYKIYGLFELYYVQIIFKLVFMSENNLSGIALQKCRAKYRQIAVQV